MEELYEMVVRFFTTYGWQLGLIALSGILLLGVMKSLGLFNKIESTKRKYVYVAVSVGLSITGCAIYLVIIGNFNWKAFLVMIPLVYSVNQIAYNVYENTGIRAAVRALFGKLIDRLKDSKDKRIVDSAEKAKQEAAKLNAQSVANKAKTEAKAIQAGKVVKPEEPHKISKKDI